MDGLFAIRVRRIFLLETRWISVARCSISPFTCVQRVRRTGRLFSQRSFLPVAKFQGTRPRLSAIPADLSTSKSVGLLRRIRRRVKDFSWKRALLGDLAVPIGYKRILQLKKRDGVPITAELVYTFSSEGLLRGFPVLANIGVLILTYLLVKHYRQRGSFHLDPKRPAMTSAYSGNPMQFRTTKEYCIALVFTVILIIVLNVCCGRGVARCYYDKGKDLFMLITYNGLGRPVTTVTKPNTIRDIEKLDGQSLKQFFGNIRLVDENGRSRGKFFLKDHNFCIPWYYNHLSGSSQGTTINETEVQDPITEEDLQKGTEHVAAKLAQVNAVKMENYRKSQVEQ